MPAAKRESLMPLPIELAHALTKPPGLCARDAHSAGHSAGRQERRFPWNTTRTGKPVRIDTVVVSTQHTDAISENELRTAIIDEVISRALPADMLDQNTHIFVNPTGRFLIGGPAGDSGLTGRKLIVDTYGGYAAPRRRRVLRQGFQQGGPQRCLHGALHRQERRGRRSG